MRDNITAWVIGTLLLLAGIAFIAPQFVHAATRALMPNEGGTGIATTTAGNVGNCLKVLSNSPFLYTIGSCGGSAEVATTTVRGMFSATSPISYNSSTGIFSVTTNYSIPLTASTTEWARAYASTSALSVLDTTTLDLTYTGTTGVFTGSVIADSIGDTQLAFNTGQNLTTASSPTFSALTVTNLATLGYASTTGISGTNLNFTNATGSTLFGFGLSDCDTALTSKLLWDTSTGKFSCGTDQTGAGGGSISTSTVPSAGNLAYWTSGSALSDVATGTLTTTATGTQFSATRGLVGGSSIFSWQTGYDAVKVASSSNWESFYLTPSGRITANDGLTWSGNNLNFDGGNTPSGDLGGTWASPSVTDDSHAHTGTTLSGIDISSDTNLSADGTEIVLTGDALSLGTALTFTTGTSSTAFQTALLGVGTDYISDITGSNLSIVGGALTAAGDVTTTGTQTLTNKTVTSANLTGTTTMQEGASILLDSAGSADGSWSGITATGTAGYTQAYGDVVYLDPTDSRWEAADANSASGADGDSRGLLGIVVVPGTDGTKCTVLLNGIIRADAKFPSFTINNPIYVAEIAGSATTTQPVTTDVVIRIIGGALTADEMYFNPDWTWVTHI